MQRPLHRASGRVLLAAFALLGFLSLGISPAAQAVELTTGAETQDFIVLYSLGLFWTRYQPQAGIFTFDHADFQGMYPHESVWIDAHGSIGRTGGQTAAGLLALFRDRHLPPATPWVYLVSCESGTAGFGQPSLAASLAASMRANGWPEVRVVGAQGCVIADRDQAGPYAVRIVRPGSERDVGRIQDRLMAELRPQQRLDAWIAEFIAREHHPPTLVQKAEYAIGADYIRKFFTDLLLEAEVQHLLRPVGDGVVIAP